MRRSTPHRSAIINGMALTADQRHALLLADRTRDVRQITSAVALVLASNPETDLLEIETAFRDAAAMAYLVATNEGFAVVIGMTAWRGALAEAGLDAGENRAALLIGRKGLLQSALPPVPRPVGGTCRN